jgi:polysaccharide pyruvyl transferase WcaK-like protein
MNPRRILLLFDNSNDANWGSQATSHALRSLLSEAFPEAQIIGVERSAARPASGLRRRLCEWLGPRAAIAQNSRAKTFHWLTESWRAELNGSDLIVVNGEGTLHTQKQATRWLTVLALLPKVTQAPIWIVNSSLEITDAAETPLFTAALGTAAHLALREPISFRLAASLGLDPVQSADCAFLAEPAREDVAERLGVRRPYAVVTGSALVGRWPAETQRAALERLQAEGLNVVWTASERNDIENFRSLRLDLPLITNEDAEYREYMRLVADSEILVGGRFHPLIFAATAGVPFVATGSTTRKIQGLMEMLGSERCFARMDDEASLTGAIGFALEERDGIRTGLLERSSSLRLLARANLPVR